MTPELFSFWQPLDGGEVPIEGPILESITVIPNLQALWARLESSRAARTRPIATCFNNAARPPK